VSDFLPVSIQFQFLESTSAVSITLAQPQPQPQPIIEHTIPIVQETFKSDTKLSLPKLDGALDDDKLDS
jgi:hypothetical protein